MQSQHRVGVEGQPHAGYISLDASVLALPTKIPDERLAMILAQLYRVDLSFACDAPRCSSKACVGGETVRDCIDVLRAQGWTVQPVHHYCAACTASGLPEVPAGRITDVTQDSRGRVVVK